MKKIAFLISICLTILFMSCEKVDNVCNVSDPLTELPWLMEEVNRMAENTTISKAIFKDKGKMKRVEGFIVGANRPYVSYSDVYYDCSGKLLCRIGSFIPDPCGDNYKIVKEEVIYVKP